jgi:hypothetical protein
MSSTNNNTNNKSSTSQQYTSILIIVLLFSFTLFFIQNSTGFSGSTNYVYSSYSSSSSSSSSSSNNNNNKNLHRDSSSSSISNANDFDRSKQQIFAVDGTSLHPIDPFEDTESLFEAQREKRKFLRKSPNCSGPFLMFPTGLAGISNQRENWVNFLLFAEILGIRSIMLPEACPVGYVRFLSRTKYSPPYDYINSDSSDNSRCSGLEVLMDVKSFLEVAEDRLGFCVFDQRFAASRVVIEETETFELRDWRYNKNSAEALRQVYNIKELLQLRYQVVQETILLKKQQQNNNNHKLASSSSYHHLAFRPSVPLTTVYYSRYYDRCDTFCACNEITKLLRPNKLIQSIVHAIIEVLKGDADPSDFEFVDTLPPVPHHLLLPQQPQQ